MALKDTHLWLISFDNRKVGEAIEEALQRMACPHPLQAHQIQGLDYQAVLPVVQWLVKRVLATLEEFGDQVYCLRISRRLSSSFFL